MNAPADAELILRGIREAGITHVASLPDINLVDLIDLLERDDGLVHVELNREEEGVGIATGVHLGGGMPALLIQNAGLLNACNPLTTTALAFEWRNRRVGVRRPRRVPPPGQDAWPLLVDRAGPGADRPEPRGGRLRRRRPC